MKRRGNADLARYLAMPLDDWDTIRPEDQFRARSYNLSRQVLALIDHLYVRYPVPLFLYRTMLSPEGQELVFGIPSGGKNAKRKTMRDGAFRHWFFAVARGDSFARVAREVLTKREAHWFLLAPGSHSIKQNIFWAKAAAAGLPPPVCDYLVERFGLVDLERLNDRLPDFLRFYRRAWPEMRGYDRDEITDFVRAALQNPGFSFKGRTFGSMRKLCQEWHRTVYADKVREYRSWSPMLPPWEHRIPGGRVQATELTSNRALADEGKVQRHCVFTYTSRCLQGLSRIASIRWYALAADDTEGLEQTRLTLEVSPDRRAIVQIRGKMNRLASREEMEIVRRWAGEQGLVIGEP
jgi:hypothetical protein